MFSLIRRFRSEAERRFNPTYLRYRWRSETKHIQAYLHRETPVDRASLEKIRFSIVVPTYGIKVPYLKDFVASVERQTFANWQLCICNDGDPDPSVGKYLARIQAKMGTRLKLVQSKKNEGICAATRKAFALADHEFIVFADADDMLHRYALEIVANEIAEHSGIDFLYSNHDYMTDWGLRLRPMSKPSWSPELLLHVNYINHLKIARRELLNRILDLAFDSSYNGAQDWNLCFQILQTAKRVRHVPFFLYHWRSRKGSMADDFLSKPWAVEAQRRLRTKIVPMLSPRLRFVPDGNFVELLTKPTVLEVDTTSFPSRNSLADIFDSILASLRTTGEEFVHFTGAGIAATDRDKLAAYCVLPKVGCVWPYRDEGRLRCAFTIGRVDDETAALEPIMSQRSDYSKYSGNVLAGPLCGMTISARVLEELLKTVRAEPLPERVSGDLCDAAGALISIAALSSGLRNVAVGCVRGTYAPGRVELPVSYAPGFDPYI